ncbi:MAG: glycosyltransferase family 4 protein [Planctomycetes bacterium]|nr:glycosyltransferase family 4 protein [Planctomycetota bacterium]
MKTLQRLSLITSRIDLRGSAVALLHLASGLQQRGLDVQILCRGGSLLPLFRQRGLEVRTLEIYGDSILNVFTWGGIVRALREHEPDLLHFQHPNLPRLARALSARLEIPHAVSVHSSPPRSWRPSRRWMMGVSAVSESLRAEIVNSFAVPSELVTVLPDGVGIPADPLPDPLPAPSAAPSDAAPIATPIAAAPRAPLVVGAMNRLERDRGLHFFVRAARKLADAGCEAQFVVVGEGPEDNALRRAVRELGLSDRVTIAQPSGDYRQILGMFDIFVSTSQREGLGIFCLEAMAQRKPVVAFGVGGVFQYLRDGANGIMVPELDSDALAEGIKRLIEREDLRRRFGEKGLQTVRERFSIDRCVDATLEFYAAVLQRTEELHSRRVRS